MDGALSALTRRIDRLEQENRRWKRLASMALALLGVAVLLGAATGKKSSIPEELRTSRLLLMDKGEKPRAEFSISPDHRPGLIFSDDAGKPRLTLSLSQHGEPTLSFADAVGQPRVVMGIDLYGTLLRLADAGGNLRAALLVPSEGEPELELVGKDNKVRWRAP
jgi:hypothetical protein